MATTSPAQQDLQALILHILEKQGSISDTSKLVLPSSATPVDPQLVQAVLTSLASRNVCFPTNSTFFDNNLIWRLSNSLSMNRIFGG
jgi:hypothetical protein